MLNPGNFSPAIACRILAGVQSKLTCSALGHEVMPIAGTSRGFYHMQIPG